MFRSKPIGWITAGTLFCVAGVALACRLRDGKETTAEANAAACPSAAEAKDESSAPAKTTAEPKEPEKKEKESPFPAPPPSLDKPPAVGEVVAPAATTPDKEAKSEREKTATAIPPSPPPDLSSLPAPPAPPTAADTAPVPEVRKEKDVGTAPAAPPRANLLSPEMTAEATPIRPISGNEGAVPAPPADPKTAPAWSAVPASEKKAATKPETKSPELLTGTAPPPSPSSGPVPPATIPMKEEAVGPPPVDPNRPSFPPPSAGTVIPSGTAPSETTQRTRPTLVFRHHVIPSGTAPTETTQPPLAPPASSMPKPLPMTDTPSMPPTSPATPLYKVRGKGETLREIAGRTLGSGERWQEIYRLNPDLHPELIVPSGKEVRLPADAKLDAAPDGGQAESEHTGAKPGVTAVRPLPVVRPRQPQASEKGLAPLTGTYSCQLDNRSLVLPKEAADQLGKVETMLLTPGPDRCLWLGTQASVARVLDRVEKSGAADREVQTFRRLYFAQTEKASVTEAGKMLIPEKLVEYAGLGKEVVLVGIDDHFELWDAARWQRYSQQKEPSLKP